MQTNTWAIVNNALLVIGVFLAIILSCILLKQGRWRQLSNRLLVLYLTGIGSACGMTFLIANQLIFKVPILFRLFSPLHYWMFPAGFLYVYITLTDSKKIPLLAWLLFLPGLLHVVEMMPFYLLPKQLKLAYMKNLFAKTMGGYTHGEGWLPNYAHNQIRGVLGTAAGIAAIFTLVKFSKQQPLIKKIYPGISGWLWVFASMMLLFGLALLLTFTNISHWSRQPWVQSRILSISFASSLIVSASFLILYPQYLFGMPRNPQQPGDYHKLPKNLAMPEKSSLINKQINVSEELVQTDEGLALYYQPSVDKIVDYMLSSKPYLIKNYKISDLARDINIPQYHLSIIFNRLMNKRFNDYINEHRIAYIKNLIATDGQLHSLEGLATMAGFANRVTFSRAAQRITGQTPSTYFYNQT
jgi:AraC-like DNA-binding protein